MAGGRALGLLALAGVAGCAKMSTPAPVLVHHVAARGDSSKAPPPLHPFKIKVVDGDTVYGLARHYRLPIAAIIRENNLKAPYALKGGQVVSLPKPRLHKVKKGETVYSLAQKYDLDLQDLIRDNELSKPYVLQVGDQIRVPEPILPPSSTKVKPDVVEVEKISAKTNEKPKKQREKLEEPDIDKPMPVEEISKGDVVKKTDTVKDGEIDDEPTIFLDAPRPVKPTEIVHAAPKFIGGKNQFITPVSGTFLSTYGPQGQGKHNDGVNIAAPAGTPVKAVDKGTVVYAGNEMKGFGNLVLLKHANGWTSAYAHLDKIKLKKGQVIESGDVIGAVGASGHVSKPQLHFELRKKARTVNPLAYVKF